jgi:hypothetical protein
VDDGQPRVGLLIVVRMFAERPLSQAVRQRIANPPSPVRIREGPLHFWPFFFVHFGATWCNSIPLVVTVCGVAARALVPFLSSSVEFSAIDSVSGAGRMAPFSAPLGTTVGTSELLQFSVPVALMALDSSFGASTGMLGRLLTEASRSTSPFPAKTSHFDAKRKGQYVYHRF